MSDQSFLESLTAEDRAALMGLVATRRYGREETVITQSDETADVFFVLEGEARATIYSPDGKEVAYRDIGPGEIFGELSAIDGAVRSASVIAVADLKVGRLSVTDFRKLIETRPGFTWALLRYFSAQIRRMTERVFEFSTMLVRGRLVNELLRLAEATDVEEGAVELHPLPTQFDLAARISTHREAVSREMSRLAKMGLISKKSGRLVIQDIAKLRALAGKPD